MAAIFRSHIGGDEIAARLRHRGAASSAEAFWVPRVVGLDLCGPAMPEAIVLGRCEPSG